MTPRLLVPLSLLLALLMGPGAARAQLVIPGLNKDSVALPVERGPKQQMSAALQAQEEEFRLGIDRLQGQFRWQVERLEQRRAALGEQQRSWRTRRSSLSRRRAGDRIDALDKLLVQARDLDRLLRDLQEAYDSHLRLLLEAESAARSLKLGLEDDRGIGGPETTSAQIDEWLEEVALELKRGERRLADLDDSRVVLEESAENHRDELNSALKTMFEAEKEDDSPEEALPDGVSDLAESEAREELRSLLDEERRITVSLLEFAGELDRARLSFLDLQRARAELPLGPARYRQAQLEARKAEVASHEEEGIFYNPGKWKVSDSLGNAWDHTKDLLSQPRQTASDVVSRAVRSRGAQADQKSLLGLVALLALLAVLAASRLRGWIAALEPRSTSDALVLRSALGMLPVLPLSFLCVLLVGLDLVPEALGPITRFSAIAPPLVVALLCSGTVLFPVEGSESLPASVARYMRRLLRLGAVFGCVIGLAAALMPLLGYGEESRRLLKAALAVWLLLGWMGMLLRRKEVLALIGADGDVATVGILRAGIRRSYRVIMLGPVVVFLLYALGYENLTVLLVRGGLVTLSVMLLAPWVYEKLRSLTARGLGYPDGGGWLALSPEGSRAAFRSAAPLLLLAVGGSSLALVAAGWDFGSNLLDNLVSAMTSPLLDVGGSQITGLSLVLLAVTIALTFLVTRWVLAQLHRNLYPVYDLDRATKTTLDVLVRYVLFGVGVVVALDVVGVGVGVLTVFAGTLAIGLGFGSQTLVANFISGLILLLTRRISVEDVIEVEGQVGRVLRISSFSTVVRTLDNLQVIVPNSKIIDSSVTNWSRGDAHVRLEVVVEAAYGSDVALVRRLLLQVAQEDPRVLENPAPLVRFDDFGASGLRFTLNPWVEDAEERLVVSSDLRFRIDRVFKEHGVEIPFSQQDVRIRAGDGTIKVALEQPSEVMAALAEGASADVDQDENS